MSWTTSPPYSIKPGARQPTDSTAATTPPPVISPKPVPRSLAILSNNNKAKPRTPVAPHKLAQLANALGVATPSPGSVPYPLYSPSTPHSASFGASSSTPSRYLLHVIPPLHLLQAEQEDANDPHVQTQFRRGTLVSLHPTLSSQLGAIAREFSLPSTGGMILYLITTDNDPGPRITDDAWRMLWFRALQVDKDGSTNGKNIARYHSRSTTSTSPYPSPSTTSDSQYGRLSSPSSDNTPASSVMSLDLPISINPGAALPILAKVEFDIDRRKAPWYELWRHRRRTTSHSVATSLQFSGGLSSSASSSTRVLQLPLRARSTSPSLAEFKAKYSSSAVKSDSPEGSERGVGNDGFVRLDDGDSERSARVHLGEFTEDPLEDVFPSDRATWAQIHVEHDSRDTEDGPGSPHTPDMMIGGRIGSTILSLEGPHDEDMDENEEDVIKMWKQNHKPTLESLSTPPSPGLSTSGHPGGRSRSASKHVPPPLDLTATSKSQIPHVEIAPPTATSPNMSINSDLPYLDSDGHATGNNQAHDGVVFLEDEPTARGNAGIRILVENSSGAASAAGSPKAGSLQAGQSASRKSSNASLVGSEEARSRRLDELERRIENLSPRSQWDEDEAVFSSQQPPLVESPESGSPLAESMPTFTFGDHGDKEHAPPINDNMTLSKESLPVPSVKASRRQISIGSFTAIPTGSALAQALAAASASPPLPPVPTKDDDVENDEGQTALSPPIDLATPMTPGFPISPDPFNRQPSFTAKAHGSKSDLKLDTELESKKSLGETSPVSPPPRMSSRFSADSVTSDDGQSRSAVRADRAGSIISVKGIRSLWRKSGNSKNAVPLMSPGINGQHMIPPTPPPFMDSTYAPPLPMSSGGFFSPMVMTPPPLPKTIVPSPDTTTSAQRNPSPPAQGPPTVHGRSDSGLDPFHFDQDSRYPVHNKPSPSQAFADTVPPAALPVQPVSSPPPPPSGNKKGILKGWGSKGGSQKRTSADLANANRVSSTSPVNHPPSSFGSISTGKKGRRPSLTNILGGGGHSKQGSKASISSMGSSKHNHPNNSLSGTSHASSHASSHQGAPSLPSQSETTFTLVTSPSPQLGASGRSSHEAARDSRLPGGLSAAPNESRKSTPPPPGAVAIAAAVAASRERRGTSYIGPADNRI